MFVYVGFFGLIVLLLWLLHRRPGEIIAFCVILFAVFLFVGYRYWVGCDYFGYLHRFMLQDQLVEEGLLANREILFDALVYMIVVFGGSYDNLNIVAAAIFCTAVGVVCWRHGGGLLIIAILFPLVIIQLQMSGLRQAIALSILLVAFSCSIRREWLLGAGFTILAAGFHTSAVVFLPFAMSGLRIPDIFKYSLMAFVALPFAVFYSGDSGTALIGKYLDSEIYSAGAILRVAYLLVAMSVVLFFAVRSNLIKASNSAFFWLIGIYTLALLPLLLVSTIVSHRMTFYMLAALSVLVVSEFQSRRLAMPIVMYFSGANFSYLMVWFITSRHAQICYLPYDSVLFSG